MHSAFVKSTGFHEKLSIFERGAHNRARRKESRAPFAALSAAESMGGELESSAAIFLP
jgi:hypothetical protein